VPPPTRAAIERPSLIELVTQQCCVAKVTTSGRWWWWASR